MAHENARILVVEDEDNLAMLIEYNLNKIGYVSEIADDGEKALDILKEKNFDLVVLDWMIPKISGIEVCRRIRGNSDFNKLPIIMLTALGDENDKIRLINQDVSNLINPILRKIVSTKEGTAGFANVAGFEVGGKTGTADQPADGEYSKKKINTFASVFPASDPKFALVVMLDEPKPNKEFVYNYRDGRQPYKGNWRNTAGWTTVWVTGQIIDKIGPILATKY